MGKLTVANYQKPLDIPKAEHDVLDFWDQTRAFAQSVQERPDDKRYVFYDGPPFATGLPHYGHILTSVVKDAVPRYWTMKGYRVDRVWGWDCHGIPIENMIEKELGLKGGKKGIEALGIDKFNAACRAAILRFDTEWEKVIRRIGRWVDFKHSYKTMDPTYMESVWWAFKNLYDKGLVYEGRKVILYCPRCATPLSNFEIAMDNSYKDVQDTSVYVKFRVKGTQNEYFVAWTTTPWTLIGNVGLAVHEDAAYVQVNHNGELLWLAATLKDRVLKGDGAWVVQTVKGKALVGRAYEPLYTYMPLDGKKAHYVAAADFVSLEDGTGIVHTAAIYGEDDYRLAVQLELPCVPTLDDQGKFLDFVQPLAGVFYKKSEPWIVDDLTARGLLLRAEAITHSYPFCYRCETPLYYNAIPAWFINIQKLKPDLAAQNENIHWYPQYLKHGRFGNGLSTAPDWNISRSRYWGTPMPIWKCQMPNLPDGKAGATCQMRIIGSVEELKQWAVNPQQVSGLTDIHREFLDDIEVWVDQAKTIKGKRIPEVFDCWVESGSMPYSSIHYPFAHKALFEKTHPAQFIVEYISQTRAWFYTLHVMSVGLFGTHTFDNALTHGVILAEDGSKMSKSKKNYPDPSLLFEKYGVDALRLYLMGSVVMKAENLNFSELQVKELYQKVISTLWNVFSFYKLYAKETKPVAAPHPVHQLDRWIVSRTMSLVRDATAAMDGYDLITSCRAIEEYVADLSTWYLRGSRDRIKKDAATVEVFGWVLVQLVRVMAPFTPFIAELIYQNLVGDMSVHLTSWPQTEAQYIDTQLEEAMADARKIVEGLHGLRKEHTLPVKQALGCWSFAAKDKNLFKDFPGVVEAIEREVNVHTLVAADERLEQLTKKPTAKWTKVLSKHVGEITVWLDTEVTPQLLAERKAREVVRQIQALRKARGCTVDAQIGVQLPKEYQSLSAELISYIKEQTGAHTVTWADTLDILTG